MNKTDENRILNFYVDAFKEFGDDVRSVQWAGEDTQRVRFEVLNKIADLNGKSVLDVGCGLADLYKFFLKKNIDVDYTGLDMVPEFIRASREKYPDAKFILGNAESIDGEYDYILASGSFNFTVENAKEYYFNLVENIFEHAREGMAFNLLDVRVHGANGTYMAFVPSEVVAFCKTLTPHVKLVEGYLDWDFTIYMYK